MNPICIGLAVGWILGDIFLISSGMKVNIPMSMALVLCLLLIGLLTNRK